MISLVGADTGSSYLKAVSKLRFLSSLSSMNWLRVEFSGLHAFSPYLKFQDKVTADQGGPRAMISKSLGSIGWTCLRLSLLPKLDGRQSHSWLCWHRVVCRKYVLTSSLIIKDSCPRLCLNEWLSKQLHVKSLKPYLSVAVAEGDISSAAITWTRKLPTNPSERPPPPANKSRSFNGRSCSVLCSCSRCNSCLWHASHLLLRKSSSISDCKSGLGISNWLPLGVAMLSK